jgi:polysaccharide biosynthesis protein PslA
MTQNASQSNLPLSRIDRVREGIVAGGLIVLLLPLMVLVAIAIKCDSRGPVFVWGKRVGPRGQPFWALRFRTTVVNESSHLQERLAFTFVGNVLCRLRIDALPQLFNVLRGEMTCFPGDPERLFFLG